jgi:hypothetical protein
MFLLRRFTTPLTFAVLLLCQLTSRAQEFGSVIDFAEQEYASTHSEFSGTPATFASAEFAAGPACCPCNTCQPAECNCPACQAEKKKADDLKKAIAGAYKPLFYDNNFSYLNNPNYNDWYPGDHFKQVPVSDCWMLDLGGQYRARYQGEHNMRGLGLTGLDDNFLLHRTRLFLNAKYSDWFRFYGEFIDAESNYENFPIRLIEVNRADMLNLFADTRVFNGDSGDLWFRIGRQELLYGSERLISPLDWANTRRTFEGFKFFWQGEDWNIDFFMTRPIFPDPTHFDSAEYDREFFGAWATYKAIKNQTIDLFAIQYNNAAGAANYQFTTLGGRWLGSQDSWLWETEGGVQFGENTDGSDHQAGFATGGLGYKWADACWTPTLWGYYDWASGGDDLGAGNGFNHLFPLAHKYLGFMDLFGRSNIQSPNVQLTLQPTPKLKLLAWYYYLMLDTRADTPYTVVMTPENPGYRPVSRDLGHELDLIATYTINPRMDLLFGYSHFFSGSYFRDAPILPPTVPFRGNADFFYVQYQWNF